MLLNSYALATATAGN